MEEVETKTEPVQTDAVETQKDVVLPQTESNGVEHHNQAETTQQVRFNVQTYWSWRPSDKQCNRKYPSIHRRLNLCQLNLQRHKNILWHQYRRPCSKQVSRIYA